MHVLFTYYLFLIAGAVLVAALRDSSFVSQKRSFSVSYLLTPPLILGVLALNLGSLATIALTLVLLLGLDRLLRTNQDQRVTKTTLRLWLAFWLVEAAVPVSLHFTLKSRQGMERLSFVIFGMAMVATLSATFLVFSPSHREGA